MNTEPMNTEPIDVVFDGPPGPEAGRFIECEDAEGRGVRVGRWIERDDGYWALRLNIPSHEVGR